MFIPEDTSEQSTVFKSKPVLSDEMEEAWGFRRVLTFGVFPFAS